MRPAAVCALVAFTAFLGCASARDAARSTAQSPALEQRFTLKPGDTVSVGNERVQVRFARVMSDSRCPRDVQCIQAGEATLSVELTIPGSPRELVEVKTSPRENTVTSGRFSLTLEDLQPVPLAAQPPKPSEYRATFVLRRN